MTFKHFVCVSINSTQCVQAYYICRIQDIFMRWESTSEMNAAFLVCHSIQITFNDTVRSRLPLFSVFLHFGTIGKKSWKQHEWVREGEIENQYDLMWKEEMFWCAMQVATLCTHTQSSLHVFFNCLSLLGCWCYKNNHCSLVVVNNECFSRLPFFLLPIRIYSHSMVSHYAWSSNENNCCCLNMVD